MTFFSLLPTPTMSQKTYLACIGTRPEIIKMAPVYRELKSRGERVLLVHTGQHEAVAQALYTFFDMQPDIVIDLQRKSSSLVHLSTALMESVDNAIQRLDPDVVMVQGDTTSAFMGAMVGYYQNRPVAHIEAGLRTGEREPFPEEKNRELIGRLARWHFAPTRQCKYHLLGEGIEAGQIFEVGNTVIDAALWTRARVASNSFDLNAVMPENLSSFRRRMDSKRMILVTAHRRENWGQPIRDIAQAVAQILTAYEESVAIWPVHPNPAVRADVEAVVVRLPLYVRSRICLTEPLGYQAMISLIDSCDFTLTDSGGIQEEASAFGKPVLVARKSTERQELVSAGGARLVGTDVAAITDHAMALLTDANFYRSMQLDKSPFGDGQSARHVVDILTETAQLGEAVTSLSVPVHYAKKPIQVAAYV